MTLSLAIGLMAFGLPSASATVAGSHSCEIGTFTVVGVTLTKAESCEGSVVIPTGVEIIGNEAFAGTAITSVTIPSTVTSIDDGAFLLTRALTEVIFESNSSLTTIGNSAFLGSSALTSIEISSSVTSIASAAFIDAVALESIYFQGPVPTMGTSVFQNVATSANAFVLPSYASGFVTSGGMWNLLNVKVREVVACTTGSFSIIDDVVSEGISCTGAAVIPAGVTAIGVEAFKDATGLTSVTMPSGLTSIGGFAFNRATSLINVSMSNTLTSIGPFAFYGARELTSIVIPSGVTSIESSTFHDAEKLSSVTFAAGSALTEIKNQAFENAFELESIVIPSGVISIGNSAFWEATSLSSVTFASDSTLLSIDRAAFYKAPITSIIIPSSVTSIGAYAFELTSLSRIYFLGDALPEMDPTESPFYDIAGTPSAYIKDGATGFVPEVFAGTPEVSPYGHGLDVEVGVYSVAYNNQGATTAQRGGSNYYIKRSAIETIPTSAPIKSGHTFTGWYTARSGGIKVTNNSYTPASPFGAVTLYARWTKNPVKAISTVKPKVSGTAKVRRTLTANKGTWTGYPTPTYSYQWYACSKKVTAATSKVPSTCKKISGATKSTLKLKSSQKKKYIAVLVTGTSRGTAKVAWLSKTTSKVK